MSEIPELIRNSSSMLKSLKSISEAHTTEIKEEIVIDEVYNEDGGVDGADFYANAPFMASFKSGKQSSIYTVIES